MKKQIVSVMTQEPVLVKENDTLEQLIEIINLHNISHLLVIDEEGKLMGVISKEDVLTRVRSLLKSSSGQSYSGFALASIKAKDIMTSDVVASFIDDDLDYVIEILLQKEFHCVPIVDRETKSPLGIITLFDIVKSYHKKSSQIES